MNRKVMKKLLIATIIIALVEWLRTGYIDGLCFLWTAPLIILADDGALEDWAKKKLEEMDDGH